MPKRKQYIIDRKFQLRTAFSLIGFTAAVSLVVIAAITASIVYNNEKITNIYEIENNIFQLMQDSSTDCSAEGEFGDIKQLLVKNHERNLLNIIKITRYNRLLLTSLIICLVLQGVILFVMIIKITHRISGPLYVMSGYMKEIISGKIPAPRDLREKDEFRDFYDLFREMVNSIRKHYK